MSRKAKKATWLLWFTLVPLDHAAARLVKSVLTLNVKGATDEGQIYESASLCYTAPATAASWATHSNPHQPPGPLQHLIQLHPAGSGHPVAPAQFAQINLAADFGVVPPGYGQFEETDDVNCDEQGEISFCWFLVLKGFQFYWTYYRSARRSPGCQLFIHGDFSPNCSNSFRKAQPATLNFKLRSQVTVEVIAFTQKL